MTNELNLGIDDLEDLDTPDYKEFFAGVAVGVVIGTGVVLLAT